MSAAGDGSSGSGQRLRVMTFNVRGSAYPDGANAWEKRAAANVEAIKRCSPALIGLQEAQDGNLKTYRERLQGYTQVPGPEYGDDRLRSFNAILFDPARLELLDPGGFWLSETPDVYSGSWGTTVVRSVNVALFALRGTDARLLHLNTHLDHKSEPARRKGGELVLRKAEETLERARNGTPVLLTGDFNCRPGTPTYGAFAGAGFADAHLLAAEQADGGPANTFHAFKGPRYRDPRPHLGPRRIDWILLKDPQQSFRVATCKTPRAGGEGSGTYPSDHYPVVADLVPAG